MPISEQQKQVILDIDIKVKKLIKNRASPEDILVRMINYMPTIKSIMSSADENEMDFYS
ncbi:MAG: hypothetical protein H0U73_01975 [Tatlockia sp.]|nr:hypothetical protein [Tatlockia sp.]